MKTNFYNILLLAALLFAFTSCTKKDSDDSCIMEASIQVTQSTPADHLHAVATGGLAPYTYYWSNGIVASTAETVDALHTDAYALIITDAAGCKDTTSIGSSECTPTVTDVDGNVYNVIRIVDKCWMTENLRTTHFANGATINEVEDSTTWATIYHDDTETPAWCYYRGNAAYNNTYGRLYNWYAASDQRNICPQGWRIAEEQDYLELFAYLGSGGLDSAGGRMKALTLWAAPNTGATNLSGFTALPAGLRFEDGRFANLTYQAFFWTGTSKSDNNARYYNLYYNNATVLPDQCDKNLAFSCRCVHD